MSNNFSHLLSPMKIGSMTVKNRFVVSAMQPYEVDARGGFTNDGINYYVERAKGGFGMITIGSMYCDTQVDPFSLTVNFGPNGVPKNFICTSASMNDRIHAYGAKSVAQITMGVGRNGAGFKSASEVPSFWNDAVITGAYTADEIKKKIDQFITASITAKKAGFDAIEVHAMHWGYLLDQFAMSITNHREDEYGGTLENRIRICKEIVEGIKQVNGADYPVLMKMGLKSYMTGLGYGQGSLDGENEAGRTLEESIEIIKLLKQYGYDAISCNAGIYESMFYGCAPMYVDKGFVLPLAAEVKKAIPDMPLLVAGRMNDPYLSEKAVADGVADGIVMARQTLADPYYPQKIEMGRPDKIRPCISCNEGCVGRLFNIGRPGGCAVNPSAMREQAYHLSKAMTPKKVMVVGGGIAGMEAARSCKLRGHEVEIYEKSNVLSGNQVPAWQHEFKSDIRLLNEWYQREIADLDIPVHFNAEVSAEMVKYLKPDAVILAIGGEPIMPASIQGIDHPKSVCCTDALMGKKKIGHKVVVVGGGMTGCELALDYAMHGKDVTIVEGLPKLISAGGGAPWMNELYMLKALDKYKVKVCTNNMLTAIDDDGVHIKDTVDGSEHLLEADTAVLSLGFRANKSFASELHGSDIEVYEVKHPGGGIGNVMTAIWNAYEISRSI